MKYSREWLDTYRTECNPKAKRQYETALICFGKAVKKKFIKDITASDVQRVYNSLAGKSESYIHKFAMTINAVFKSAYQDGIIQRNPAEKTKPPKGQTGEHRVLEPWERKLITSTYKGHDFGLCAMVMMFAGLRRG